MVQCDAKRKLTHSPTVGAPAGEGKMRQTGEYMPQLKRAARIGWMAKVTM